MATTTKIFKSNQTQAVRLPKAVAFPEEVRDVVITAVGSTRVIAPADQSWDAWFDGDKVSDDFMRDSKKPTMQERESLDD